MLLTTILADPLELTTQFEFTVPGDKNWKIRSVLATVERGAGGAPGRAYQLTVATSTGPVAVVGAPDAGTDPGTATITWANAPASKSEAGSQGIVLAPFNPPTLEPGYTITGTILNPVSGDIWLSALVWYDFALTGGT